MYCGHRGCIQSAISRLLHISIISSHWTSEALFESWTRRFGNFFSTLVSCCVKIWISVSRQVLHARISRPRRHMTRHKSRPIEPISRYHKSLACLSYARFCNATISRSKLYVSASGIFNHESLSFPLFLPSRLTTFATFAITIRLLLNSVIFSLIPLHSFLIVAIGCWSTSQRESLVLLVIFWRGISHETFKRSVTSSAMSRQIGVIFAQMSRGQWILLPLLSIQIAHQTRQGGGWVRSQKVKTENFRDISGRIEQAFGENNIASLIDHIIKFINQVALLVNLTALFVNKACTCRNQNRTTSSVCVEITEDLWNVKAREWEDFGELAIF